MARNLNSQMLRVMSVLALVTFAVVYFGLSIYYTLLDWFDPEAAYLDRWTVGDFISLGLFLAISLATAAFIAWRQAQNMVRPLKSVAVAARAIAEGKFSVRAEPIGGAFSEAETLIADFNAMAARLEHAETELKYSNSAIAHELRTPLTILRGRLQGLADGVFQPNAELYGRLIAHVDDLTRIVEDLRILGLSSAGKMELKLDDIDLAQEAEAVLAAVEHDLAGVGITVERDFGHAVIVADRERIRQALFAILDNARRYAPGSVIAIKTRTTRDRALIRCSDTGPGLPAGLEDRVFERFWRGDDSRARAKGGSGLGLSVVQAIAQAHGGDVTTTSNDGKGMAIEIWLPARPS